MIFLSAQPDEPYFLWQIQLQLFNFSRLGILPDAIHVLVGYHSHKGLHPHFKTFFNQSRQARFFAYPDLRKSKKYASSIRPHIIANHLRKYPELEKEIIFYHDSDIVLREQPDWDKISKGATWSASYTGSYMGPDHILQKAGEKVFKQMCCIVDVDPIRVINEKKNAGGAQYLFNGIKESQWQKIECDCERLYLFLSEKNMSEEEFKITKINVIDAWLTDMWVVWWNALRSGITFKISDELDFCWANSPREEWSKTKILHYTGDTSLSKEKCFSKSNYQFFPPFYSDLSKITPNTCSFELVKIINDYKINKDSSRIDLNDFTFFLFIRTDNHESVSNLDCILKYINKYFKTHIKLYNNRKTDDYEIHSKDYVEEIIYSNNNDIQQLVQDYCSTSYAIIWNENLLLSVNSIVDAADKIRNQAFTSIIPHKKQILKTDKVFPFIFSQVLDSDLLEENQGKMLVLPAKEKEFILFLNCFLLDKITLCYNNEGNVYKF